MALLSVTDRTMMWRGLMRHWSNARVTCSFPRIHLYDPVSNTGAIADADNWLDTHSGLTSADTVGFNGALSATYRALLTAQQKNDPAMAVAAMRRGANYARSILGDLD